MLFHEAVGASNTVYDASTEAGRAFASNKKGKAIASIKLTMATTQAAAPVIEAYIEKYNRLLNPSD